MPLPHWLTRVNLAVTNRLTMPLAARLPWFGVLEHVGRRSGAVRRTPLNVFQPAPGRWVVALTYGPDVQWLHNIHAAGRCRMLVRGAWLRLVEPRVFRDPARRAVPPPVRWAWRCCGSTGSWNCARSTDTSVGGRPYRIPLFRRGPGCMPGSGGAEMR